MPFIKGKTGNPNGRPKGSGMKPRLSDYLTESQVKKLIAKAYEMAENGNEKMLQFVLEHNFGKAAQSMDITSGGKELPQPILNAVHTNFSNTQAPQAKQPN